jgi:uncharacterized protein YPO0396
MKLGAMMGTPPVHHLVTIRLDEHVEQLERAYSAFLDVRNQLSELCDVLDDVKMNGLQADGSSQQDGMERALLRLRGALRTVGAAMEMVSPLSGEAI